MKFSYTLLKKLVPEIKNPKALEEHLSLYAFEVDGIEEKTFDIKLPANRYGDAASHWGVAQEIAATMGIRFSEQRAIATLLTKQVATTGKQPLSVTIEAKDLCARYIGAYCENVKVGESPKWIKEILTECGMRPINNVVDIMNYVMLETGQPLHAFDYDKLEGGKLIVRRARKGESIVTLDDQEASLTEDMLIIADAKRPLAIAGIKGGKLAEVDKHTKRIVIEAANFDPVSIYKTSRAVGILTDASARFARTLSPELATLGAIRSKMLLQSIMDLKQKGVVDIYPKKQAKKILKFELNRCNAFLGTAFDVKTVRTYFELLGFTITPFNKTPIAAGTFLVTAPALRTDIEHPNDLYEEIVRLHGFGNLRSAAPYVHLVPSGFEDGVVLKDKVRRVLTSLGMDEVYNHSFVSDQFGHDDADIRAELVALENPISKEYTFMRPTLAGGLHGNVESNSRYFDAIAAFEVGRVFAKHKKEIKENNMLGIVLASKGTEQFFALKGLLHELFKRIGLNDVIMREDAEQEPRFAGAYISDQEMLCIESDGECLGYLAKMKHLPAKWHGSIVELDMALLTKLVVAEHEYVPLPKYPSIVRDISVLVNTRERVGDIMQAMQLADSAIIEDVDLIDEYENEKLDGKRSLTFRIIFQAEDRTLTDEIVNKDMEAIVALLRKKFSAEIR
ncbi:MAG: Phenylalanine-tRNA ligase beta subunit [Candidatus Wolfebacteria bacterium GW2011_GWC2_39_22]|uniref:Phenylalanine--tRNA ligase beta subunit n=1 Tax=Candidatus Wolfebacteria bacterium GW2011_GWC2_39_22 TaxID=1619013 RepID=A0A0G0QR37_9BACT|nr:MAG: Phenylalanine-tRNA ligase beta subunit [Candidatus Wolfebacteria bacterium GW2011_GWC2_39_22]HBI25488.1 phenylalanine--tRNA ligase subunit beta [Candidatus Wolfebacteria bacterium]